MNKIIFVLCILFSLASNLYGDEGGIFNGEDWILLSQTTGEVQVERAKTLLIRGIYEGAYVVDYKKGQTMFYPEIDYLTLASAVDQFYSDYNNKKIPVAYALTIISDELQGKPKDLIDEKLNKLREAFKDK